eukprot:1110879-Rhodomonas_salina.1
MSLGRAAVERIADSMSQPADAFPGLRGCGVRRTLHTLGKENTTVSKWRREWRNKFKTFLTIVNDDRFRSSKAYLAMQSSASNPGLPSHLASDAAPASSSSTANLKVHAS